MQISLDQPDKIQIYKCNDLWHLRLPSFIYWERMSTDHLLFYTWEYAIDWLRNNWGTR